MVESQASITGWLVDCLTFLNMHICNYAATLIVGV